MILNMTGPATGGSAISAPIIGEDFNWTGGDGTYQALDDGGGNWRIKFLSSGTFTPLKNMVIDAFLLGAGGGSGSDYCGAGGAGYTTTVRSVVLAANTAYPLVIGAAGTNGNYSGTAATKGGTTSAFAAVANGGERSVKGSKTSVKNGANGGSGGAGFAASGGGGIDGGDGANGSGSLSSNGGKGQGTTTREFGEADGDLYASGGGGNLKATVPNSGNGGYYGGSTSVKPADGIVVIRQHKEVAA
jgi:hypothetical protein